MKRLEVKNIYKIYLQKAKVFTIPNLLSSFRVITSPYIGYLILTSNHTPALVLFALASLTDLVSLIIICSKNLYLKLI